jgi:hypothetical protein
MKNSKILFFVWVTLIIMTCFSIPFFLRWLSQDTLSQYGSYIGGLVGATFTGLGFIILVLTYRHQLQTSDSSKKADQLQYVHQLYELLLSDLDSLSYRFFKGIDVFYQFTAESVNEPQPVLDQLNSILNAFENIIYVAHHTEYENDSIKTMTLTRIYFLYYSKILWPVHAIIYTEMKEQLNRIHDDAKFYLPKYEALSHEAIDFLAKQKLVSGQKGHLNMK